MKKIAQSALLIWLIFNTLNTYAGLSNKFHIYFNRPVNTAVSSGTNAQYIGGATVDTIVAYINRAQYSIDVAQYDYTQGTTMGKIGTAINNAYSRGVVVRWVDDGSQANTGVPGLNAGIHVVSRPTNSNSYIMHDKFMIIDANAADSTLSVVYTASMDWGLEQDDSDFNNTVFIQSQQLAKAYTAQFNQMWGGSGSTPVAASEKFGSAKSDLGPHIFTIDGIEVELYFSPTDSTNNHILDAIASANSQLYFGMYTFSESLDAPPINAKYNAGVDVAGIIDQFTLSTPTSQWATLLGTLGASRLKEYVQANSIYHNKYLIVDACNVNSDPLVLTGSHNWTVGANEGNDENTIIMHDPTIANIYYQAFNANFAYLGGTITGCTVNVTCNNVISTTTQVNNNVLCYGASTGSATVHAHGAGVPFTYAWSGGGQTDSTLSNVRAGTYTVTVTDHNACSVTASVTITQPSAALHVTGTPTSPTCFGENNGQVSTTVSGGTGSFAYAWSSTPTQTSATATNLTAGTYTVTVTDANHCTTSASATVAPAPQINIAGTTTGVSCQGNNGTITPTVTGGSGAYTYNWSTSPHQTTAEATNLAAGSYTLTVTDSHSCTATASFTVSQSGSGITLTTSSTTTGCGQSTGSVTVTVTSGPGGYIYAWSNGATTATVNALGAGNYTVTVSATGGCSATGSAAVSSGVGPVISATSTPTTCGKNNGVADVTIISGTGPYTYNWTGGGTSQNISNLNAGNYTVTVTDANHCVAVGNTTVGASSAPSLSVSATNATCSIHNGSATASVSGGTNPYSYTWSNGSTTISINNLGAGTYHVTVTDHAGCSASAVAQIDSMGGGGGTITVTSSSQTLCAHDTVQLCAQAGFNSYNWSTGANTACIEVEQTGAYTVTASNGGNCNVVSSPVQIMAGNGPQVTVTVTNDVTSYILNCSLADYYQWYFNGQMIAGATSNVYVARYDGVYTVNASSSNGCSTMSQPVTITITGIANIADDAVKIYPNPSYTGYWQLKVPAAWIGAGYQLLNTNGDVISSSEVQSLTTDLKCPAAQGVYFLKITSGSQSIVKKVIKL